MPLLIGTRKCLLNGARKRGYRFDFAAGLPASITAALGTVGVAGGALKATGLADSGPDLMVNGGLEQYTGTADDGNVDTFTGWSNAGTEAGATIEATATAHGGSSAVKLGPASGPRLGQSKTVIPGATYTNRLWTRASGGAGCLYYQWFKPVAPTVSIVPMTRTNVTGVEYTQVAVTAAIPADVPAFSLFYYSTRDGSDEWAYMDDVTFYRNNAIAWMPPVGVNLRLPVALAMPAAPDVTPIDLLVRGADALNYWAVRVTPNTAGNDCQIIEVVAGVETVRAAADVDWGAPELIANGGFETAGAGGADVVASWVESSLGTGGAIARTTTAGEFHGGAAACKITASSTVNVSIYQNRTVIPGATYALSFWTRGDGTNPGYYKVTDASSGAVIINNTSSGVTGTDFAQVSTSFTAPADCTSVRILCYVPLSGGIAYFDDVSLKRATLIDNVRVDVQGSTISVLSDRAQTGTWTAAASYATMATQLTSTGIGVQFFGTTAGPTLTDWAPRAI